MRDSRIELYRCLLTWGIVFLHVAGGYAAGSMRLSSAFVWCVPGFVFITGYFGSKFSWKKVLKIYGVALWCYPVTIAVRNLVVGGSWAPLVFAHDAYEAFLGNWFIHAYVGLMMLAPIIDGALAKVRESKRLRDAAPILPFLIFVFGWSFLSNYNCARAVIPKAPSCSLLTLLGTYAVARVFHFCEIEERISVGYAAILFVVGVGLSLLKIGKFNSVVAIMITIGAFALIRHMHISDRVGKVILWAAPSMFSVFLLHATPWCLQRLKGCVDWLIAQGIPLYLSLVVVTTAVFVVGFLLDLPRRGGCEIMEMKFDASTVFSRLSFIGACLIVALHIDQGSGFLAPLYHAAVPMFFMMSGYWLVGHVKEKGWWKSALAKRVKTLIIPYFFWITATLGVLMILKFVGRLAGLPVTDVYGWRYIVDSYGWNLCEGVPANMWYVRCLYIFVLLSAGIVALVRKSWILGATLAVAAMLLPQFVHLPLNGNFWYFGFNAIGFGWFVIGIILRLAKSDRLLLTLGKWGGGIDYARLCI